MIFRSHKINKNNITDKDGYAYDYQEFMYKYRKEIKYYKISQECLDKMIGVIIDIESISEFEILDLIKNVYISVISIKFQKEGFGPLDIGKVRQLIVSLTCLNNNRYFAQMNDDDIGTLCKKAFDDLSKISSVYHDVLIRHGFVEEFNKEHFSDTKYYLDKFVEIGIENGDKDFLAVVQDNNLWRFT